MPIYLSSLLHDDKPTYVSEGYGGREINVWPFYSFIVQYFQGEEKKAKELWVDWLVDQYLKYGSFDKASGGMDGGSVQQHALACAGCKSPNELSETDIRCGAHRLVDRRIKMLCSLRDDGFDIKKSGRVIAIKVKRSNELKYVLRGGHHRAAALHALGYTTFPNLLVLTPVTYRTLCFGKKYLKLIRSGINDKI